jgi:DNA-binding Lrp family transcriptional regulator
MVVAYVMVKAATGDAERLKAAMNALEGVEHTHVVAGDVDFVAKVAVDSPTAVRAVVTERIQAIDGVADTRTYIAMD